MRNPLVAPLLLLLLVPATRAAPRAGGHRAEDPTATGPDPDPDPDPLSPELPALPLLRGAVRSLGPPERDAEAMTREQALLYLFVLHDHDRSERLDGLELLQLLGAVLEQRGGGRPDPHAVTVLVDRALARQDLSGDGLLDPSELLLWPGRGPPGQPLSQQPGEPPAGAGEDAGTDGGDTGVSGPAEGLAAPPAQTPDAEATEEEEEEAAEAEAPNPEALGAEEALEIEGGTAPVWGDTGEG